jgi:hypothetical protein
MQCLLVFFVNSKYCSSLIIIITLSISKEQAGLSLFFSMALPANSGPRPLIQFRNHYSQSVGFLGRVISPSQGRYLNTGQKKTHTHTPNIHALSGIRTNDLSVRAREESSCRSILTDLHNIDSHNYVFFL